MVAKAENGAIVPVAPRTYQRPRSSGRERNGASPCMKTRFTRPRSTKLLMNEPPQAVAKVSLTSADVEARGRAALAWSMSRCSCGVSSWLLGRTPARIGSLAASASSWSAAADQRVVAEPAAVLQLQVEAGRLAQPRHRRRHQDEDLAVADLLRQRPRGALGDRLGAVLRAPAGPSSRFRWMKAWPRFCPLPAKLKPATVKSASMLFFSLVRK